MSRDIEYRRRGKIIEIIVRESNHAKIDTFTYNEKDSKTKNRILKILKEKYNINFIPDVIEDRDLDWLK